MEARILETGYDDFIYPGMGLEPEAGDLDYDALARRLGAEAEASGLVDVDAGDLASSLMSMGGAAFGGAQSGGVKGALGALGGAALGQASQAKGALGSIAQLGSAALSGGQSGGAGGALGGLASAGANMLGGAIKSKGAAKKTEGIAMGIGAAAGGALGSMLGPAGTALGGAIGGFLGKALNSFGHWMASKFKKKPSFAEHLAKVDPGLLAVLKKTHPKTIAAMGPNPLSVYPPDVQAKLRAQLAKFSGKKILAPAQVLKLLHKGGLDKKAVATAKTIVKKAAAVKKAALKRAAAVKKAAARRSNVSGLFDDDADLFVAGAPPGGTAAPPLLPRAREAMSVLTPEARRVRDALLSSPALRSLNAAQLSQRLLTSHHAAIEGQRALVAAAGLSNAWDGESLDAAMVFGGRPSIVSTSRRLLRSVPRPAGFAFNRLTSLGQQRLAMLVPAVRGLDAGKARMLFGGLSTRDAAGLDPTDPFYIIESGDTGQSIAKKFTGDVNRWPELVKANPSTADAQYGFKAHVGQRVALPVSWTGELPAPTPTPELPEIPGLPSIPGLPAPSAPAPTGQGWAYVIQSGDTGQGIAKKFTGDVGRWPELVAANPSTADAQYGFKANVGQKVVLPPSWWANAANVPGAIPLGGGAPAPGTPPVPPPSVPPPIVPPGVPIPLPGGGTGPIVPPSVPQLPPQPPNAPEVITGGPTYAKAQVDLAAWARATGSSDPADFGSSPSDLSGVRDERTARALMGYQMWAPQNLKGQAPLRTDGELDQATFVSLETMLPQLLGKLGGQPTTPPIPTVPLPSPGPAPAPAPKKDSGGILVPLALLAFSVL